MADALRLAVVWPRPRAARWQLGRTAPHEYPDLSDGLLFLEAQGFSVVIEESLGRPLNPLVRWHEFFSGLDPLRALRVASRLRRYDAIICVGDSTALVLTWLKAHFGVRTPIIMIDPSLAGAYARRERLLNYVLPRVDCVVLYGRVQVDYLRERYGARVRTAFLHHRADVAFYAPGVTAPSEPPIVFSIGNDISRDYATLLGAAPRIVEATPAARIVVQSTLPMPDTTGVEVRRPQVSYARLRDMYAEASVVVVPLANSRHAGGINALLEAQAMGKAVVVSGSEGIADYVEDGRTALVVPPGNAAAMAEAVTRLLGDAPLRTSLGAGARQFVESQCRNETYASRLSDVIRAVVADARGNRKT